MYAGCQQPYTGNEVRIDGVSPWQMYAPVNVLLGFVEEFCVKCQSLDQVIYQDEIKVQQQSKCSSM